METPPEVHAAAVMAPIPVIAALLPIMGANRLAATPDPNPLPARANDLSDPKRKVPPGIGRLAQTRLASHAQPADRAVVPAKVLMVKWRVRKEKEALKRSVLFVTEKAKNGASARTVNVQKVSRSGASVKTVIVNLVGNETASPVRKVVNPASKRIFPDQQTDGSLKAKETGALNATATDQDLRRISPGPTRMGSLRAEEIAILDAMAISPASRRTSLGLTETGSLKAKGITTLDVMVKSLTSRRIFPDPKELTKERIPASGPAKL